MSSNYIWIIIYCSLLIIGCDKNRDDSRLDVNNPKKSIRKTGGTKEPNREKDAIRSKTEGRNEKSEAEHALRKFASDWENVAGQNEKQDTLAKQKELALAFLPKLGGSDDLLTFLDFLTERGAGDLRKELIESHLGVIFTGTNAEDAREWLLTVEDEKLREPLSRLAGQVYNGVGFKDFFEQMGQHGGLHSQAALLTGYCTTMAKSNPEAAIKVYQDLGHPKRIDNTGMAEVMAAMPPTTDFLKFATGIKEDSMTLAKRSRTALLRNWAGVKPQDAAQYVLANANSGVAPEQMAEVISVWTRTSPEGAGDWLAKAPEGKPKDEGSAALARHWSASDPVKAWEFAAKVGDFNKKVETATEVFKEWEKRDRDSATKAWIALFPAKNQ